MKKRDFAKVDIYPVISSEFTAGRSPIEVLKMVADGGAKIVQMREKNMADRERLALAEIYRKITEEYDMMLIINDSPLIAAMVAADGVHLGQDDLPISAVRRYFPGLQVGVSTHDEEEARRAQEEGCDFLNVGPIYSTQTKTLAMAPVGLETLERCRRLLAVPFSVMGGIKQHHLAELAALGVRTVAMVTEITMAEDVTGKVKALRRELIGADV